MNHCKQTVFLILLMLVLLLPLASAEGARAFITVDDCVPLEIREGSAVTAEELIVPKWGNVINPQFGDQIHPSLTNGDTVVHGGEHFKQPALIDTTVVDTIRAMIPLAPLHNPANLAGIEVAQRLFPGIPQVAVFDTAFHQTMPPVAFRYALPVELYQQHKVRRYGFHGTSHQYVAQQAAAYLQRDLAELNLITLHLGNGCSATAIAGGKSVDTSMGMTPLEGLVMGTRCGDIDPALHFYLQRETGLSANDVERLFNKQSGLKGLCGVGDMREVQARSDAGDTDAQLAEAMFAYRVKKYIGAYIAVLGRIDAVVFTGGIGEHSARVRAQVCANLQVFGIYPDLAKNAVHTSGILAFQQEAATLKLLVIPTNEELEIARSTAQHCLLRRS